MTVNRNETITLPKWLLLAAIPVLVSVVTAFGFEKSTSATRDEKISQLQERMKDNYSALLKIDGDKVDRTEFKLITDQLNRIEDKLNKGK